MWWCSSTRACGAAARVRACAVAVAVVAPQQQELRSRKCERTEPAPPPARVERPSALTTRPPTCPTRARQILHTTGDWKQLQEYVVLLSKRRSQLRQAVQVRLCAVGACAARVAGEGVRFALQGCVLRALQAVQVRFLGRGFACVAGEGGRRTARCLPRHARIAASSPVAARPAHTHLHTRTRSHAHTHLQTLTLLCPHTRRAWCGCAWATWQAGTPDHTHICTHTHLNESLTPHRRAWCGCAWATWLAPPTWPPRWS